MPESYSEPAHPQLGLKAASQHHGSHRLPEHEPEGLYVRVTGLFLGAVTLEIYVSLTFGVGDVVLACVSYRY